MKQLQNKNTRSHVTKKQRDCGRVNAIMANPYLAWVEKGCRCAHGQKNMEVTCLQGERADDGGWWMRARLQDIQCPSNYFWLCFGTADDPMETPERDYGIPWFMQTLCECCRVECPKSMEAVAPDFSKLVKGRKLKLKLRESYGSYWVEDVQPWPVLD